MATMYDPPHLGELIRESIDAEGWTVTGTAERLGVSRVALSRVLNGHASVSAALALALERIGWSDAEHWMRMQAIYDLAQERRKQATAAACRLTTELRQVSKRRGGQRRADGADVLRPRAAAAADDRRSGGHHLHSP